MDHVLVKDKSAESIFSKPTGTQIKLEAKEAHDPIFLELGVDCKRGLARFIVPPSIPEVLNLFSRYGYRVVCCAASPYTHRMCWTLAKEILPG
ncbi:hypothetical protein AAVH_16539 [Aphelenchoides avenae]|nr:hypothetical protein AAVH_16539 [Aphelenchus avenae]